MLIVGITGGIGSGKTTITNIFSLLDIPVYIADTESKRITDSSPIFRVYFIELLGEKLYDGNRLNKKLLASHIFSDEKILKQVNAIIHPEVEKDFQEWIKKNENNKIVILESAILFESGFNKLTNKIITVYTPLEERVRRTMARDNISEGEVIKRINKQMSDENKKELSDFVIVNDNKHSLIEQVLSLVSRLLN